MKKAVITQSDYIPWKGYFDAIRMADEFVLYDDAQYTKRDWRNRNKIKSPQGIIWLTIPVEVKGKYFQKIRETKISDKQWNINHWLTIKHNYNKAKCFNEVKDFLEELYMNARFDMLSDCNFYFLQNICDFLDIKTTLRFTDEFELLPGRTEKLVDICRRLNITDYYSGPSAQQYMEQELFDEAQINVHYFDYNGYKEYSQLYPPFEHGVSIIDLLCNEGKLATQFF